MKYPSIIDDRFFTLSSIDFPRAAGTIEKVLEIPSCDSSYGSLATDDREARAPCESLPCIGLAPGANGSPAFLPSGVLPVFLPYTTFEVIVSTD